MQIEALIALINATDPQLSKWDSLASGHRDCGKYAAGLLTRKWLGTASTYQSRSCKRHLTDAKVLDALQRVRDKARMALFTVP